jgi:hypothetical protein
MIIGIVLLVRMNINEKSGATQIVDLARQNIEIKRIHVIISGGTMNKTKTYRKKMYEQFVTAKTSSNDLMPLETNAQEALDILVDFILPDYLIASAMNQKQANTCIVSAIMSKILERS